MTSLNASESLVSVKSLCKSFGSHQVLGGVDFNVQKGEVVALIGSSGSGKTTMLRCLNLLETPTSGRIEISRKPIFDCSVDGTDNARLREADICALRSRVGMVFQQFNLFAHKTVLQCDGRAKGRSTRGGRD